MTFTYRIKTTMAHDDVVDFVSKHCNGSFRVTFEDMDAVGKGASKTLRLIFEQIDDRRRFHEAIGRKQRK